MSTVEQTQPDVQTIAQDLIKEAVDLTSEPNAEDLQKSNEEALARSNNPEHPAELSANLYSLYLPKFQMLMSSLSKKALMRVLEDIILVPLAEDSIHHPTENEQNAAAILHRLMEAKYVMIFHTYNQHLEELYKAKEGTADPEAKTEAVNEETKETVNG